MKKICFIVIISWVVFSCTGKQGKTTSPNIAEDTIHLVTKNQLVDSVTDEVDPFLEKYERQFDSLAAKLPYHIRLDTLLERLTNQQNVEVLAWFKTEYDDFHSRTVYKYSNSEYKFELKIKEPITEFPENIDDENVVFSDGTKKIDFRDYQITCTDAENQDKEDLSINNLYYTLGNPQIIQVCQRKFLYADLNFMCNGTGCGMQRIMIYDLKEKKPTFLHNYRLPFNKFLVSDFNGDGTPDLLVVQQSKELIDGTHIPEFHTKLSVFIYDKGVFMHDKRIYMDLYGIGDEFASRGTIYTIIKNNWFKD